MTTLPSNGRWYARSIVVLQGLALPLDVEDDVVARATRDAYPFGERKYHPYKAWLRAVKDWKLDRERWRAFSRRTA